ncbi:imidazoleglycerol-phosphate dehydratase HisB [Sharpea azabuensis]|uniref:Imidazoleglycerol-phosphate dehydratase n=1 Tax=Sharpea azabuensis TaxID=322505 RepID=A0A1H6TKC8_9FIRM|nr:imidazoleglycerol-phosphate dehydratase HisB [Sharpea azabuensis]HAJ14768.1 imidazoleglycerol-phosphate dehydratase HisB [Erysipelotrichaceae bacterium]SEI80481.1 imidazoleglycerol-phosphate dehydratase [Sharpea azabuensis]SFD84152.1 imidazoleglycerol-phosphate dehydratase [Sharpea azabuensis]SFK79646.1 imidazoleglycerol-phosphate dehydratase [Sharpea azabuensis]HAV19224.1 imidazoleglycerol-phosphate dehydratase HisB [Erysipelotrichaceae bacterium]
MREAHIARATKETKVKVDLNLDGSGQVDVSTGVGFMDHMLELLAFHGKFDLYVRVDGDLQVDSHHTIEDLGIVLGQCLSQALGDKKGITRYGAFTIPMDEALVACNLDLSGRPFLVFNVTLDNVLLGNYQTEMTEEFFRAFAFNSGMTLHFNEAYGKNMHHVIEACFKSFARALKEAVTINEKYRDEIVSSKGVL